MTNIKSAAQPLICIVMIHLTCLVPGGNSIKLLSLAWGEGGHLVRIWLSNVSQTLGAWGNVRLNAGFRRRNIPGSTRFSYVSYGNQGSIPDNRRVCLFAPGSGILLTQPTQSQSFAKLPECGTNQSHASLSELRMWQILRLFSPLSLRGAENFRTAHEIYQTRNYHPDILRKMYKAIILCLVACGTETRYLFEGNGWRKRKRMRGGRKKVQSLIPFGLSSEDVLSLPEPFTWPRELHFCHLNPFPVFPSAIPGTK